MQIPSFSVSTPRETIADALDEAGCVVVTGVLDESTRNKVRGELSPHMQKVSVEEDDPTEFYAGLTRRTSALVARSESVGGLVADEMSTGLCDRFLSPNGEFGYHLHVSAALEVGPGARRQILHREEDSFTFFSLPRPNLILASMWAISDFRPDNGGTLVVPGSHRWAEDRKAKEEEICEAEMPAGSVLYWLGGLLHGAGANISDDWRYGVILTYSLGWLRQEENQYLDVPPHIAKDLPERVRELIGYNMYRGLGFSMNKDVKMVQDI